MSAPVEPEPDESAEEPPMELRARAGRAVLVGHDGTSWRDVDPATLALTGDLTESLHEWAQVAGILVPRDHQPVGSTAGDLVSRRGLQLARRLATELGVVVSYADPVSGSVSTVQPAPPRKAPLPARTALDAEGSDEPTPWATGLTVTAATAVVVMIALISLSLTLAQASPLVATVTNIVVAAGLAPSVWLARGIPIWRWVALGVAGGIVLAWTALLFSLLG